MLLFQLIRLKMVSIKDINKNIKKNLFDPIDKAKNKFSSLLNNYKKK